MATNKAFRGKNKMKKRRWEEGHIKQVWGRQIYKSTSHWLQKGYNARVLYSWEVSSIPSGKE
jgi:hypothetical protein